MTTLIAETQDQVLRALPRGRARPQPVSTIARQSGLSATTVRRYLDALVEDGRVVVRRFKNGYVYRALDYDEMRAEEESADKAAAVRGYLEDFGVRVFDPENGTEPAEATIESTLTGGLVTLTLDAFLRVVEDR